MSAENGRWEEAKITSLCGMLCLRLRPLDDLRVDINVHGGCVIDGVVLRFLRETVRADAFHCYVSESSITKKVRRRGADRPGRPLPCVVLREDRRERVGTESRPYLIRTETLFQRAASPLYRSTKAIMVAHCEI